MWELDSEESWAPKNSCFWTVMLEKTLESPLDRKEIQPVYSKGDQFWVFFGRNDAKAETPLLWPPHVKSWLIGKDSDAGRDWGQEGKWRQRRRWLDGITDSIYIERLDGPEFWWTPGVGDGQGGLVCCNLWGRKESDTTEWLNWTDKYHVSNKQKIKVMNVNWQKKQKKNNNNKKTLFFLHWLGVRKSVSILVSDENGKERKRSQLSHKIKSVFSSLD